MAEPPRYPQSPARSPRRAPHGSQPDRTWLWALLAFLALTLGSLALAVLIVSGGQIPNLGSEGSWTPPPLAQDVAAEDRPSDVRFAPGDSVVNASAGPVNIRRSPGFQNKPADDVIVAVPAGSQGAVLEGPQPGDGLLWWKVRFGDQEGWMAEQSSRGLLLLDLASQ